MWNQPRNQLFFLFLALLLVCRMSVVYRIYCGAFMYQPLFLLDLLVLTHSHFQKS